MSTESDPFIESNPIYGATSDPPRVANSEDERVSGNETAAKDQLKFIALLSLLIVMVAATCSLSLSQYVVKLDNTPVGMGILIVYMTIGVAVIGLMCLKADVSTPTGDVSTSTGDVSTPTGDVSTPTGDVSTPTGDVSTPTGSRPIHGSFRTQLKVILRHSLSIVGMSIFYPFSCILDLFNIFTAVSCGDAFVQSGNWQVGAYVVEVYFHLMRILFMGSELVFCYRFHNAKFVKKDSIRCGIMIIMIVNIGLWFITLLSEAVHRAEDQHMSNQTQETTRNHVFSSARNTTVDIWTSNNDCLNFNTTQYHFLTTTVNQILYPFSVEFSLLVGEYLAEKFFYCQTQTRTAVAAQETLTTMLSLESSGENSEGGDAFHHTRCRMLTKAMFIAVGLFVNVVCITLSVYVSLEKEPKLKLFDEKHLRFQAYMSFYWILATVLPALGFFCGGFNSLRARPVRGLDNLIMISALGPLVSGIINSVAFAQNLRRNSQLKWYLRTEITNLIQVSLQVPFLFYSDRVRFDRTWSGSLRRSAFRGIVLCLAMCNITIWIRSSCRGLITDQLIVSSLQNSRSSTWRFVDGIFVPLGIFFRFNSFLLFVRAFLGI